MKRFLLALGLCLFAGAALANDTTTLRICAGSEAGNYTFAAREIERRVKPAFQRIEVQFTAGSVDNLRRLMEGTCDVGFAQSDVVDLFRADNSTAAARLNMFKNVYSEYVHLMCPVASGWSRVVDIGRSGKARIIVGPDGSGPAMTWRALRQADDKLYGAVERLPDPVNRVAVSKVKDSRDTCLLWVSGLNSEDMQAANRTSVNTRDGKPAMALIDVDDRDFRAIKGFNGEPLYRFEKVERRQPRAGQSGLYENLIHGGWFSSASVTMPVVDALLIIRRDYEAAISTSKGPALIQAIEDSMPTIWAKVNPK
jgi:hypothetical protein